MKNSVNKKSKYKTIKRSNNNLSNNLQKILETRKSTIRKENIDNTKKLFLKIDTDNSGYIDIKELHKGLKKSGINLTIKNTKKILKKYDDNPDGKIEMREFINFKNDMDTKKFSKKNLYYKKSKRKKKKQKYNKTKYKLK